ncbi:hypothetical protein TanjilG_05379 [Lupinus angustifolius]|uniref:Organ specific protein n=1 Tax=Lupinus angustifolius TaxID=3871 RepID=A0A1J7HPP7_LUPAN|nr:PREDICTED: uncharacterized protein LOC109344027 [Lupinus angustifolius]OIW14758.1 hypothetical protein TanjilG_05379 [Lupinus angustifolius]
MKSIFVMFIVFSLLSVANLSFARKDIEDYWKNKMKGQPMPELINDLLLASDAEKSRFIRDFDIKPNVILYHTRVVSKEQKQKNPFVKKFEAKFKKLDDVMVEQIVKKD